MYLDLKKHANSRCISASSVQRQSFVVHLLRKFLGQEYDAHERNLKFRWSEDLEALIRPHLSSFYSVFLWRALIRILRIHSGPSYLHMTPFFPLQILQRGETKGEETTATHKIDVSVVQLEQKTIVYGKTNNDTKRMAFLSSRAN